jgi:hypothetical protein
MRGSFVALTSFRFAGSQECNLQAIPDCVRFGNPGNRAKQAHPVTLMSFRSLDVISDFAPFRGIVDAGGISACAIAPELSPAAASR